MEVGLRFLLLSDQVHPHVHSPRFPQNLPPFDLVLAAGDLPGEYLEYVASKVAVPVLFVPGNHGEEWVGEGNLRQRPGGAVNLHGRLFRHGPLLFYGIGGVPRYREGEGQLSPGELYRLVLKPLPLLPRRLLRGHGVDVLLTHAPPPGPTAGEDFAHRGSPAFLLFHRLFRPRLHVHGHTPLLGANPTRRYRTPLGVEVVHAQGYALVHL
ncbi:MAG: metallophosphoesterase [Thermus sp.]|uniref:metallophosphoesterase n=1 Tax=unclassified Thermus TaxID=2619321 RepID=UPI000238938C|nr:MULTISPECIES: metallophosphoesterase [unclassified Thermus]AEV17248.1 phosphohydrolase [Thermus sp. CCB_US3_UF1]MCS6867664.1 metallophosphoesterase [Thermus sp.]MCS7217504.1 metallophosphoesterase [Thermus sp.]MDW8016742.1 metallophosphoesterase [Thermus sp.]MDW8357444.1 metallophosphoesterase [Thermus sp.]